MTVGAFGGVKSLRAAGTPTRKVDGRSVLASKAQMQAVYVQSLMARALEHFDGGRFAEVEPLCLKILAVDVRHADALYVLGMAAFKTGRNELAVSMIRRAIAANCRQPFYHSNLGSALQAQGKTDEAIACFERALEVDCGHVEASFNLGNIYLGQKKLEEAAACYRRALAAKPEYPDAHCNLGNALKGLGKLEEAAASYRQAVDLVPGNADLWCNLGDTLHQLRRLDDAVSCFQRTLELDAKHAKACNCLGNACFDQGKLAESIGHCTRAVELNPEYYDAQMNVSLLQLQQGEFLSGWRNYGVRWKVYPARSFVQPLWQGVAAADGPQIEGRRILIHAEQGLGDALQFMRYVPLVRDAGGTVVLDIPPRLWRLAQQLEGVDALVPTGNPLPPFDLQCPLMSLPQAFGTTLETIPARVPYLAAPPAALEKAARLHWPADELKVGLAWTGNASHPKNWSRSIPLTLLEPVLRMTGVQFFSLQMGPATAEIKNVQATITDLMPMTEDMADTAAQMAHLDLILTIDTSIAHLAGALGRPCWLLLSSLPDWRWLLNREDSPWYPTMRLFRQAKQGEWGPVVEAVRAALEKGIAQDSM
jgi:tetratricopeptide (TPR) repeat protein